MKTIWKVELATTWKQVVMLPRGARIISVQVQRMTVPANPDGPQPCLWAIVDSEAPLTARKIVTAGTGWELGPDADLPFIGTYQTEGLWGGMVWHVFDGGDALT